MIPRSAQTKRVSIVLRESCGRCIILKGLYYGAICNELRIEVKERVVKNTYRDGFASFVETEDLSCLLTARHPVE